jgi:hypothetical protein
MNRWNNPIEVEHTVTSRDRECAYCRAHFDGNDGAYRRRASWEHVINDLALVTADNIVLCCIGCNASKGAKPIEVWLSSSYCRDRAITAETVSPVVRKVLLARLASQPATPAGSPEAMSIEDAV